MQDIIFLLLSFSFLTNVNLIVEKKVANMW